jgi:hypothetical protein
METSFHRPFSRLIGCPLFLGKLKEEADPEGLAMVPDPFSERLLKVLVDHKLRREFQGYSQSPQELTRKANQ